MNKVANDCMEIFEIRTWSLGFIWNDATHKVRLSAPQIGHKFIQVLLKGKKDILCYIEKCSAITFYKFEMNQCMDEVFFNQYLHINMACG